jgi:hypothetical protein
MSSFVLFHRGNEVIAIPFRKTRCWEALDRSKVNLNAQELPEKYKPCWEAYCNVGLESCDLRRRNIRLLDVDLSGFYSPEPEEDGKTPGELSGLFPGAEGQLIKRRLFPAKHEMPEVCVLYPEGITDPVEYFVVLNAQGIRRCWQAAEAQGLSCGSCKAAAAG